MITSNHHFISPDGVVFTCRKEASQYFNKSVAKLEPERQDGWQVFTNATNSHVTWIAPDGQRLSSFVSAKAYARSSGLSIYGKDGLTKSIASFFANHADKETTKKTTGTIDLTRKPPCMRRPSKTTTQTPRQNAEGDKLQQPKQNKKQHVPQVSAPRVFQIPQQTVEGKKLQKMLRLAAVHRNQRNSVKAAKAERAYVQEFTLKRGISDVSARRGRVCLCHCYYL